MSALYATYPPLHGILELDHKNSLMTHPALRGVLSLHLLLHASMTGPLLYEYTTLQIYLVILVKLEQILYRILHLSGHLSSLPAT